MGRAHHRIFITPAITNQVNRFISAQEAYDLIQANAGNPKFFIYDVETGYDQGQIEGAINVPLVGGGLSYFRDKDRCATYFIYALAAFVSGQVVEDMKSMGFYEVYGLDGGFSVWRSGGFPVVQ